MKTKTAIAIASAVLAVIVLISCALIMRKAIPSGKQKISGRITTSQTTSTTNSYSDGEQEGVRSDELLPREDDDTMAIGRTASSEETESPVTSATTKPIFSEKTIVSIHLTGTPNKTSYYFGDTISLSGLRVSGTCSNGETVVLDNSDLQVSRPSMDTAGTKEVAIGYKEPKTGKQLTTSFSVRVMEPEITLSPNELTLYVGESDSLYARTVPAGKPVRWKSAASQIVSVDTDGVVTGVRSGYTTVVASFTYNGHTYYSEACIVAVSQHESTIDIYDAEWEGIDYDEDAETISLQVFGTVRSNYRLKSVEIRWNGPQYVNDTYTPDFSQYYSFNESDIGGKVFDLDQMIYEFDMIEGEEYVLYVLAEDAYGGTTVKQSEPIML